ncbi:dihydropyrimidinase [Neorhizobium sp. Rsf11]|uniref:Dihydropyrimidinase n=2 Tax=Neorhizobium TaxID=1525371 RepID=A0ABV0MC42_9HYPH|nr:dihydropyrimidinase [Neorhizobium petrolearium]MCC2613694.1 dihydropyrimidinase [Neorhizobium petrolearium]WGI72009.1 dihydropyrimidinase [Neorhizobium petrolearium]
MSVRQPFDLVIRGGNVVLPNATRPLDVGIRDGIIVALDADLPEGRNEVDAGDRLVLPGGVDSHCHMDQQPWEGKATADDFNTGTLSALCGGTTTVVSFAMQMRGQSLRDIVEDYHDRARPKARIDYGFHLIVGDPSAEVLREEIPALIAEGCTSMKIYLTYEGLKLDDYEVLNVLDLARSQGAMVMVHAENDACIRWLTEKFIAARKTQLRYHEKAHSEIGDREATFRAISLSELIETPILVSHVAAGGAVEEIRRAKARGLPIYAETCPQYLFLSAEDIDTHDLSGSKCVCTPPPRDKSNQPAIWAGILDGTLEVFSSDHSPWHYADKIAGGPDTPFHRIPNGIPGIETRLALLFSAGVNGGRISLQKFADLTSGAPARLFGLYPRKGHIAVGADADIAIWDPHRRVTITNSLLHHATDYTPYEGQTVTGWPVMTISRGDIVFDDGKVLAEPGRGRFIARQRPFPPQQGLSKVLAS